jgi:predicted transcriptional regulator of viral defense system
MKPPFGGTVPVRPLVIAVHAVSPAAVSGDTALAHWGLLSQAPLHEEVVSTPARIQWRKGVRAEGTDRLWMIEGTTIRFRRVPQREMFGISSVRLDSDSVVPMFDRERALLELLGSGPAGVEWAEELLQQHEDEIDHARLLLYAERVDVPKLPASSLVAARRRRGTTGT